MDNQKGKKMSVGTTVSVIVAIASIILAIFFYMNDSLNKRIEEAINHPDFLRKVADEVRLPFLIFDKNGTFQSEWGGATSYTDKIEPFQEEKRLSGFIVYPRSFLENPPILQGINNDYLFAAPKRINTKDWKYRIPEFEGVEFVNTGKYDEPPAVLFKLEIIR